LDKLGLTVSKRYPCLAPFWPLKLTVNPPMHMCTQLPLFTKYRPIFIHNLYIYSVCTKKKPISHTQVFIVLICKCKRRFFWKNNYEIVTTYSSML